MIFQEVYFEIRPFALGMASYYPIPIKICTPLIFVHLACAEIKGSKFARYKCAKIKGRRKNATNE